MCFLVCVTLTSHKADVCIYGFVLYFSCDVLSSEEITQLATELSDIFK